ncbi:MAG TPA: hypothetical protein VFB38_26490 [Chthonomonadaceae bacterium]|nr:hypothetical protein [Chthonomonadaceae bacterium]
MTTTLALTLTLQPEEQARLEAQAQQQGLPLEAYLQALIERLARPLDAHSLRALPRQERNRLLAQQAAEAVALYEADLARPVEQRELTAFTALDGDPVYDRTP